MPKSLSVVTFRKAHVNGLTAKNLVVFGIIDKIETEALAKLVLRPVETSEPDTEHEVGYSRDIRKPFTLVFQGCEAKLTETPFTMFRYINDLHRTQEQAEFEIAEISVFLTGKEGKMGRDAIGKLIRKINAALMKIHAPILLTYQLDKVYVHASQGVTFNAQ